MWLFREKFSVLTWAGIGAAVAVYVLGLAGAYSLAYESILAPVVVIAFAFAWSFTLGLAVGSNVALWGPVIATALLIATQAPTPDDYSWMDTGPVVLVAFLIYAALVLPALGICVSGGVAMARRLHADRAEARR